MDVIISYADEDMTRVTTPPPPNDNALVVTKECEGFNMERILVEEGSSTGIMFLEAFEKLRKTKDLKKIDYPFVGFARHTHTPWGRSSFSGSRRGA